MQDLQNARGSLASRERALRLVMRVAKDIDKRAELPSNKELVALCTQHTTQECNHSLVFYLCLVSFTGGFLWQHWLTIAGPKWAVKIIRERLKVLLSKLEAD